MERDRSQRKRSSYNRSPALLRSKFKPYGYLIRETGLVLWNRQGRRIVAGIFGGLSHSLIIVTGQNLDVRHFTAKILSHKHSAVNGLIIVRPLPMAFHMVLKLKIVRVPFFLGTSLSCIVLSERQAR